MGVRHFSSSKGGGSGALSAVVFGLCWQWLLLISLLMMMMMMMMMMLTVVMDAGSAAAAATAAVGPFSIRKTTAFQTRSFGVTSSRLPKSKQSLRMLLQPPPQASSRNYHLFPATTTSTTKRTTARQSEKQNNVVESITNTLAASDSIQQEDTRNQNNKNNNNNDHNQTSTGGGSVVGAALLFAGTAVGAGMLALPAETASAGFVPSVLALTLCWGFTVVTSFLTLEASWTVGNKASNNINNINNNNDNDDKSLESFGFLSISKQTLGPIGEIITALLFWFLLTSILVAYTSEGGQLLSDFASSATTTARTMGIGVLPPIIGSTLFVVFFAGLSIFGTERVDLVNRALVIGLVGAFVGLLGIGFLEIDTSLLLRYGDDWSTIYPQVISVGILSFGAQNVVPTLLQYLGGNPVRTRNAILFGSLIPLIMYILWEAVFLGIVPWDSTSNKMDAVTELGNIGGPIVQDLVKVFSACAIGSSMAGASVSLTDFFQDAIVTHFDKKGGQHILISSDNGLDRKRVLAAGVALGPPLIAASVLGPDAFLNVLENAGLIGGVSLYGIIPALAVLRLRASKDLQQQAPNIEDMIWGNFVGGPSLLFCVLAVSMVLLSTDLFELGANLIK